MGRDVVEERVEARAAEDAHICGGEVGHGQAVLVAEEPDEPVELDDVEELELSPPEEPEVPEPLSVVVEEPFDESLLEEEVDDEELDADDRLSVL